MAGNFENDQRSTSMGAYLFIFVIYKGPLLIAVFYFVNTESVILSK